MNIVEMVKSLYPVQEQIHSRKSIYMQNKQRDLPIIIRNGEEIFGAVAGAEVAGEPGLQGIAGSPGKVTGISRA